MALGVIVTFLALVGSLAVLQMLLMLLLVERHLRHDRKEEEG